MTKAVARSNRISKHDATTGKIRSKRPDTKQKNQVSRRKALLYIGAKGSTSLEVGASIQ
jgi:hypothetical protein